MDTLIPPLDFSHSTSSFITAAESPTLSLVDESPVRGPAGTDHSPVDRADESPLPAPTIDEAQDVVRTPLRRVSTVSSQRKKLVKRSATVPSVPQHNNKLVNRTPSQRVRSPEKNGKTHGAKSYRCDVHATNSTDFAHTLIECKQLVTGAGGKVIDDFAYPGGFLYQMPPSTPSPLHEGDKTAGGGYISIAPWTAFPRPMFNGLKLAPYGGAGELLILPVPPHRSRTQPLLEKAWPRGCDDVARKRISLWLREFTRSYGSGVSYLA